MSCTSTWNHQKDFFIFTLTSIGFFFVFYKKITHLTGIYISQILIFHYPLNYDKNKTYCLKDDEDDNEHSENSEKSEDSLEDSDESESEDTKSESLKVDAAIREHVTKQKCPNSKNPYHECSAYCLQKYGSEKKFEPHPVMERRRLRMLKIYPLLPNWREVPDYNT